MVVVGGLLAATSLQSVPDVVKAKRFEVVNDAGKVVVGIYATAKRGVTWAFLNFNKDGKPVVQISAKPVIADGGMLGVENKEGKHICFHRWGRKRGSRSVFPTRMGNNIA